MVDQVAHKTFQSDDVASLSDIASGIITIAGDVTVWLFSGDMGAGKTTLIKAVCRELGSLDEPSSPTFNIVNEYLTKVSNSLFHFDFYRIDSEEEAYDIGTEEYLDSGNYCFIEWPEKIKSLWPDSYVSINITVDLQGVRTIEVKKV